MKTLKQILEVYKPKSPDEKKFVDKHIVVKQKDRNGNGDDVFQATNIKTVGRKDERHGYDPNEDEKVYEEVEQVDEGNPTNKMMKNFYQIGKGVKKLGPEKLRQAQIDSPDKSIKGQSKAVTDAAKRAARNEEVEQVDELSVFKMDAVRKAAAQRNTIKHDVYGTEVADEKIRKRTGSYNPGIVTKTVDYVAGKLKSRNMKKEEVEYVEEKAKWRTDANDFNQEPDTGNEDPSYVPPNNRPGEDQEQGTLTDRKGLPTRKLKKAIQSTLGTKRGRPIGRLPEETEHLEEKLKVSDGIGAWISDFVHSKNPNFAGKSKKERTQMALGAFYSAKRGE